MRVSVCVFVCVSKGCGGIEGNEIGNARVRGNLCIISKIELVSQK